MQGEKPAPTPREDLDKLIEQTREGDTSARDRLFSDVYPELKRLAHLLMLKERKSHTWGQTGSALLHELWEKFALAERNSLESIESLPHFLRFAVRNMKQVLIDYSRRYAGGRRPRPGSRVTSEVMVFIGKDDQSLNPSALEINEALDKLKEIDPKRAEALELKYFGGFTIDEGAGIMEIPVITYRRHCQFGEAWIKLYIEKGRAQA